MKKIHFLTIGLLGLGLAFLSPGRVAPGWSGGYSAERKPVASANASVGRAEREAAFWDRLLRDSWRYYKTKFMADNATHVISNNYGGTISEGQSYALLKALWMDEFDTFAGIWRWTKTHMARSGDRLLGWRWDKARDGRPAGLVETENATDADQDIAYALLMAGERWNRPDYTRDGLDIARDIWRLNVQFLRGRAYLVPGTWEGFRQERLTLNPSYFAPYVYRTFARYDTAHAVGWNQLADDIYDTLEACTRLTASGLPPNWCAVPWEEEKSAAGTTGKAADNRFGGYSASRALPHVTFSDLQGPGSRDFSYDAFRVYWRMAMDARLSPSPARERAAAYLREHPFLLEYWQQRHYLPEGFSADGRPLGGEHSGFAAGPVLLLHQAAQLPAKPSAAGNAPAETSDETFYEAILGRYYHPAGYWFNDYNDFLHSVIWLHLYALQASPRIGK
jgi:endo-1,4-beta-D-glucanase Y